MLLALNNYPDSHHPKGVWNFAPKISPLPNFFIHIYPASAFRYCPLILTKKGIVSSTANESSKHSVKSSFKLLWWSCSSLTLDPAKARSSARFGEAYVRAPMWGLFRIARPLFLSVGSKKTGILDFCWEIRFYFIFKILGLKSNLMSHQKAR